MIHKRSIYLDKRFNKRVQFLKTSQFWNKNKVYEYQLKQLRFLFRHVREKIPFYIEYFEKNKIKESDFRTLKDIKLFPYVNKKKIQQNIDKFIIKGIRKKKLIHRTTGGSTATPLTVWSDFEFQIKDGANTQHYMNIF